ncbi:Oil body-associated protein 1B [Exophiala dermatitidis]
MSTSSTTAPTISNLASWALKFSPTAWLKSWLLYLGIQTHVRGTIEPEMKPLHNVCEYLHALHIYTDEARRGEVRTVSAHHFCSHVRKDLRQCLIYDSCKPDARLIGVEFMIPKSRYEQLDPEEQKLWHSHEFEVKSGMLVLPYPESHARRKDAWDKLETRAMEEVVGLYGKLYHFWEVDKGHDLPLGQPKLMGSLTEWEQLDVDKAMEERNKEQGIDQKRKREIRDHIERPGIPPNADSWWKEAKEKKLGIYAE